MFNCYEPKQLHERALSDERDRCKKQMKRSISLLKYADGYKHAAHDQYARTYDTIG